MSALSKFVGPCAPSLQGTRTKIAAIVHVNSVIDVGLRSSVYHCTSQSCNNSFKQPHVVFGTAVKRITDKEGTRFKSRR